MMALICGFVLGWIAGVVGTALAFVDAEHESACAEAYGNGVMSVPIALDESAWVELPKDADGEPIHVGDMMELVSYDEDYRQVIRTVDAVGEQVFFAWSKVDGIGTITTARPTSVPTVEWW